MLDKGILSNGDSMSVSIIIPIYNLWKKMTIPCLNSLAEHSSDSTVNIIVVDNASTDVKPEEVLAFGKSLFGKQFYYHRFDENKNFAGACNQGARMANTDYVLFLNNDTIVTPNWLDPLLDAMKNNPSLGAVGPLLLYPETDTVQHCGVVVSASLIHIYKDFPKNHPAVHAPHDLKIITGAAFLMERAFFTECEGFYEGYVNGFEDVDLCYTIHKKNKKSRVVTQSVAYHHCSQSQGRTAKASKNAKLLGTRIPVQLSNYHTILQKDGFHPYFNEISQMEYGLHPEKEIVLTERHAKSFSEGSVLQNLENFPVWSGGYDLLANYYKSKNLWVQALSIKQQQLKFFFKKSILEEIVTCAKTIKSKEPSIYIASIEQKIKFIKNQPIDLKQNSYKYQSFLIQAQDTRDTLLFQMLENSGLYFKNSIWQYADGSRVLEAEPDNSKN